MAVSFLVEFRLHGYAKEYAKDVVYSVAKKFRVRGVTGKKVVPHISLYGPGKIDDIGKVVSAVKRVGRKYTLVPFKIKSFDYFDKPHKVIYLDISPSKELEALRWELSQELRKVSSCQSQDRHSSTKFKFHGTIAFKDIDNKFDRIWSYIKNKEEPDINQYLLRITVIGARWRIVCEYDLILKKLLNRRESLSKRLFQKTINKLRELQGLPPEKPLSSMGRLKKLLRFG